MSRSGLAVTKMDWATAEQVCSSNCLDVHVPDRMLMLMSLPGKVQSTVTSSRPDRYVMKLAVPEEPGRRSALPWKTTSGSDGALGAVGELPPAPQPETAIASARADKAFSALQLMHTTQIRRFIARARGAAVDPRSSDRIRRLPGRRTCRSPE